MSLNNPKRKFSQNFLVDEGIIQTISQLIAPQPSDAFIEIGPGEGSLTGQILPYCTHYTALEIDNHLMPMLHEQFQMHSHFNLLNIDALTYEYGTHQPQPYRLIGNLPYHISTPLTICFIRHSASIKDMHLMFQKEVAERICAQKGKERGRLSLMVQLYCDVEYLLTISPQSFHPAPNVESAVIRLKPREKMPLSKDLLPTYESLVKQAFSKKRKTLYNNLKSVISANNLEKLEINPQRRAETLEVEEMVRICQHIGSSK